MTKIFILLTALAFSSCAKPDPVPPTPAPAPAPSIVGTWNLLHELTTTIRANTANVVTSRDLTGRPETQVFTADGYTTKYVNGASGGRFPYTYDNSLLAITSASTSYYPVRELTATRLVFEFTQMGVLPSDRTVITWTYTR
jgi:hypothetical protein